MVGGVGGCLSLSDRALDKHVCVNLLYLYRNAIVCVDVCECMC